MRKFITTLFVLVISCCAFAQQRQDTLASKKTIAISSTANRENWYNKFIISTLPSHQLNKDTSRFEKSPFYVYKIAGNDNVFNAMPFFNLIEQKNIASIEILKNKKATDRYGSNGKNGVIIITLKQGAEILPEDKLLDKYNIKQKFKKLPIYIDSNLTTNYDKMYYALAKIKSITVAEEKETGMKYISVLTTNYDIFKE